MADGFSIYAQALDILTSSLPPRLDTWGIELGETLGKLNPVVIYRHMNYRACVMLLYSLRAKTDAGAQKKVIGAARALAELGPLMKGKRGLRPIHASPLLMVNSSRLYLFLIVKDIIIDDVLNQLHMANAARVFASYLDTLEVKASTELFAMCCESLGMIVDILDDAAAIFPAWGMS